MAYYVFDDAKNLFEGMTKEQIVNAIANATGLTPAQIDADVITSAIKEQNAQKSVSLWVGTQNEYNAISNPDANTLYIVTDPHETNEMQNQINQLQAQISELVAPNTENASGVVVSRAESEYQYPTSGGKLYYRVQLPETSKVIEVYYIQEGGAYVRHTLGIQLQEINDVANNYVDVVIYVNGSEADTQAELDANKRYKIFVTYSYQESIDLTELTDIRVGYNGTVYGSAGEAVRSQIFKAGFNDYIKQALLNLLSHVAYTDAHGQQYYNELEAAMFMTAGVSSITAVFNQGQNVIYDNDSLEDLRQYLTVTAHYEDGTSEAVTGYILSGTLTVGTSTITVSYYGKTTTFSVTVTQHIIIGWYYPFNESKVSAGTKDFGFVGNEVYAQGFDERKAYSHIIPTEGDSSTDTQLGMKAVGLTEYPNFGGDFTFSFWCKTQSTNFGHPVFATKYINGNTASNRYFSSVQSEKTGWTVEQTSTNNGLAGFSLQFYTGGKIHFRMFNQALTKSSDFAITVPNTHDFKEWHHYAITRKNNTVRVFVDGELVASATTTETTAYAANQIALTAYFGSSAATASDITATGRGELVQDLYIAESCKWESNFDPTAIVY